VVMVNVVFAFSLHVIPVKIVLFHKGCSVA
jgi:hypothetical protein